MILIFVALMIVVVVVVVVVDDDDDVWSVVGVVAGVALAQEVERKVAGSIPGSSQRSVVVSLSETPHHNCS